MYGTSDSRQSASPHYTLASLLVHTSDSNYRVPPVLPRQEILMTLHTFSHQMLLLAVEAVCLIGSASNRVQSASEAYAAGVHSHSE